MASAVAAKVKLGQNTASPGLTPSAMRMRPRARCILYLDEREQDRIVEAVKAELR
jgi:hypothetical protein